MFGKGLRLFKVLGFEVRIDSSWLILAVLIVLSLTGGYFPVHYQNLSTGTYVLMGLLAAVGLFASIVLHELCHSLVGRRFGIPMEGITLFMFGGVARMTHESKTPKAEFLMAIAGPIASVLLAAGLYGVYAAAKAVAAPAFLTGVFGYLAWINMILAVFNLLPAFPLDGGRVLRSALWAWKNNLRWATKIASNIGAGFGLALIVLGILSLIGGNVVGGLWWCLIGMFLRSISHGSYQQIVVREALSGEPVQRLMQRDPIVVPSTLTIDELVNDYIYTHHYKMFPVVDDGTLVGCVSTREIKEVPREEWAKRKVADIAAVCSEKNTVSPDADATDALSVMNKTGHSRLLVVRDNRLVGLVTLKDMLRFLAIKLDLEGDEIDARALQQKMGRINARAE